MGKSVPTIKEVEEDFKKINDGADAYIEFIKSKVKNLRYAVEKKGDRFDIIKVKDINGSDVFLLLNKNTQKIASAPLKHKEEMILYHAEKEIDS